MNRRMRYFFIALSLMLAFLFFFYLPPESLKKNRPEESKVQPPEEPKNPLPEKPKVPVLPTRIRVMTANLTSGKYSSYDLGHGARILQAFRPDVVLIQEFNVGTNTSAEIQAWVQSTLGAEFQYYREEEAEIPNGVISRFPILKQGEWNDTVVSNRDFAWVCLDIPGDRELWVVSVHLLTSSAQNRQLQANLLTQYIQQEVPREHYLILGGDFNTSSRNEMALQQLNAVVETQGPYPVDQEENGNTNANRNKPYDWLLVDSDLKPYAVATQIDSIEFPHGLVFDSRRFQPLSLLSPIQLDDSGAMNMQHMAVIRDFLIPP